MCNTSVVARRNLTVVGGNSCASWSHTVRGLTRTLVSNSLSPGRLSDKPPAMADLMYCRRSKRPNEISKHRLCSSCRWCAWKLRASEFHPRSYTLTQTLCRSGHSFLIHFADQTAQYSSWICLSGAVLGVSTAQSCTSSPPLWAPKVALTSSPQECCSLSAPTVVLRTVCVGRWCATARPAGSQ